MESGYPSRTLATVCLVLAGVSLILQIVGLSTLGWIVIQTDTQTPKIRSYVGLWSSKNCLNDDCETKTVSKVLTVDLPNGVLSVDVDEYRAETIIGMVAIFGAFLTNFMLRKVNGPRASMLVYFMMLSSAASAILSLTAVGRFGKKLKQSHDELGSRSTYLPPYSLYIIGVGGILAALVFLIAVYIAWMRRGYTSPSWSRHHQGAAKDGFYNPPDYPYISQNPFLPKGSAPYPYHDNNQTPYFPQGPPSYPYQIISQGHYFPEGSPGYPYQVDYPAMTGVFDSPVHQYHGNSQAAQTVGFKTQMTRYDDWKPALKQSMDDPTYDHAYLSKKSYFGKY